MLPLAWRKKLLNSRRHTNKNEAPPYKNSNFYKLKVEKNGRRFVDYIFKTYLHLWKSEYFYANITEIVSKDSNDNKSAFIQIVAWYQTGDKPLS